MRTVIFGLGTQGLKRSQVAKEDLVFTLDPFNDKANYSSLSEIDYGIFENAILCVPDCEKIKLIKLLLSQGKNVMVEKPLILNSNDFIEISNLIEETKTTLYIAYNHRFEPHWENIPYILDKYALNKIYYISLFYGNGTAELVKNSPWRDSGMGVISDLTSHLFDIIDFWFNLDNFSIDTVSVNKFENKTFDQANIVLKGKFTINIEVSLVSWRNSFRADIYSSEGSVHLDSLCKWGPSSLKVRLRKHPSGIPDEITTTLSQKDPTWEKEYNYFKKLVLSKSKGNLNGSQKISELFKTIQSNLNE